MWWNLFVFGLIGLFAGAAARLFYPGREPLRILLTLAHGMVGSLVGGLLSWVFWPEVNGQFSTGALLLALLGAGVALAAWPLLAYVSRVGGPSDPLP